MTTKLTEQDAAIVKAMIERGDKMHDIAADFGVNPGRVAEIKNGSKFGTIQPVAVDDLPPRTQSRSIFAPDLDPDAPLEEQIEALRLLILTTPPLSGIFVHRISPGLADYILKNLNTGNRHFRPAKVKKIMEAIDRDWWAITADTIKFGAFTEVELAKGLGLRDGQNRLSAIARSGKTVPSYVAFGVDPYAFTKMDIGAARTGGDTFYTYGIPDAPNVSAATRWLAILERWQPPAAPDRGFSLTNDERWEYYTKKVSDHRLQEMVQAAKAARHKILPTGSLGALFYLFTQREEVCARIFIHDLQERVRGARYVIDLAHEMKDKRQHRIHENEYVALIILAWNEYRAGNSSRMRKKALDWHDKRPFPAID